MRLPALLVTTFLLLTMCVSSHAQTPSAAKPEPHRTRLYLLDGSYQVVLDYKIKGSVVRYHSAERGGEAEDIPRSLVDLDRTAQWGKEHRDAEAQTDRPVLSPELAAEEADRAARMPEVAPNLRLPDDDAVLALDTFAGMPELVPLSQEGGDLNKETAHNMLRKAVNPFATTHELLELPGASAAVQIHAALPVFYVRLESKNDALDDNGGAMTVDTHGAAGRDVPAGSTAASDYVLVRVVARTDQRTVESFRIHFLGGVKPQGDVIEMNFEPLPGGHWLRMTPQQPLEPGEYALMEVVDANTVNLGVWDFGVHPEATESFDAIHPEVPRKPALTRRPE
jgi:hypothetical protein